MIYPIPPRNSYGKDAIAYWEGFLTDEEINLILAQPEWMGAEAGCIGDKDGKSMVDKSIRSSQISWVGVKPELLPIWEKLAVAVAEVNRRFFHFDLNGFYEPMQLGVYRGGEAEHYDWHTDASPIDVCAPRKLSMALLLSDPKDFKGGEFQVKIAKDVVDTLECKRGRAWFFPSYVLHRVAPVTEGVRRSAVLWVGGPEFR